MRKNMNTKEQTQLFFCSFSLIKLSSEVDIKQQHLYFQYSPYGHATLPSLESYTWHQMRLNFHIFPRKFNGKHPHGFRGTSYQRNNANWHEIGPEVWKKKNNYCLRWSDSLVSYPDLSQRRSVDQWLKLIFERTNF